MNRGQARIGRVGIGLPQVRVGSPVSSGEVAAFAGRAEAAEFETLWVMEGILSAAPAHDPLSLLAFAAAATTTPRLGVAVIVLPRQDPVFLAKSLASIDHLSGGRLVVGLGVGEASEVAPFGVDPRLRGQLFEQSLGRMRALWGETSEDDAGEPFEPKPFQKPLPVLIGARSRPALRRAVELADGWIGGGFTTAQDFKAHVALVHEFLVEAGRNEQEFVIGKRAYLAIGRDAAATADWFHGLYGPEVDGSQGLVSGSAEQCLERLLELQELGAGHLILNPVGDDMAQLEIIAEKLLPALW